ncbi:MAG TPA: biotin/lipoyl-binding protein, partial [Dokdonella sp.]
MDKADLLHELRIDRSETRGGARAAVGVGALLVVLLAALAGGAVWWLHGGRAVEVEAATAAAPSGGTAAAVLQATGYVTARREATVSAQIIGTLTQVLIEEGEHVASGQVLATLDETAQRAALAQAEAQL